MSSPRRCLAALLLLLLVPTGRAAPAHYDLIVRNGHIIDGTGSPWYAADIGVSEGRIAAIGTLQRASATRSIDAKGRVVAPGFIDMLGQSELTLLVDPRAPSKIFQGITTEITGEGESVAPLNAAMLRQHRATYERYHLEVDWHSLADYFARLEKQGTGINFATYIGATSVREMVVGYSDRAASAEELTRMAELVEQGMREGAMGLSSALEYPPAPYASTAELIALAQAAARHGGIYATHMRDEGDAEAAALDETFRIGSEARIPIEIFHLKVSGLRNFGSMPLVIERIDQARSRGIDVAADTYAYTAWSNSLAAFTPPWANDGGKDALLRRLQDPSMRARMRRDMLTPSDKWDNEWQEIQGPQDILICAVNHPQLLRYRGKRMSEVAAEWHEDPIDALFDFLIKDDAGTSVAVFGMSEPDVLLALQQPWVSVGTDDAATSPEGILGADHPHPRAYATFARILRKYVREDGKLTLADAIRKFTALPAQREHLSDRGVIKLGLWADLVVFDPAAIRDRATYDDPNRLSEGMSYVLVNGVPVIEEGRMTGALPGKVLRGAGYAP
ncbi:MAG TPA: D-aminoacylase [Steroidobacteraceae bacterium]|nr:D-aminoacylase [Steroidobacteraceae bacterium]